MGGFCCGGKGDKMKIVSEFQGHSIELLAPWQGGDLLVEIRGGCRPHIGCISTCWFEKGEMKFEKLLLPEHRDGLCAWIIPAERLFSRSGFPRSAAVPRRGR